MRPILYTGTFFIAIAACTGVVEAPDEGSDNSTVAVCSSNAYWKDMDKGSEAMHPGGKCDTCHDKNPMTAPDYTVLGTVYPTLHEPDDCNGVASGLDDKGKPDVQIIITDRSMRTLPPIPVNSVGNFLLGGDPVLVPFWVKVVSKGKENKMMMQAPHGNCNACHTQMGAEGAPGRIQMPQ
jgi:hypothetical protein